MIRHVLVATDGSENAGRAIRFCAQVVDRHHGAEVTVVHVHLLVAPSVGLPIFGTVQHVYAWNAEEQAKAHGIVDQAVAEIRDALQTNEVTVTGRVVVDSRAEEGILRLADEVQADLIVVGTRGLSALTGAIMGSVSHALLEKAHCPVLVVK